MQWQRGVVLLTFLHSLRFRRLMHYETTHPNSNSHYYHDLDERPQYVILQYFACFLCIAHAAAFLHLYSLSSIFAGYLAWLDAYCSSHILHCILPSLLSLTYLAFLHLFSLSLYTFTYHRYCYSCCSIPTFTGAWVIHHHQKENSLSDLSVGS
ncbi:hypothetical protein DL98DRAFT_191103 [Cadophora sp. DSE1049]|nr:hypothetical protein DL98DRAFT_191103 [Cadophora sp. DSE1049]